MYDDAQDAVAAEYVLGTLSADEREHAEALLAIDPGFAEAVRLWERRLGELNVMVEAVEPPAEIWDKIKKEIAAIAPQAVDLTASEEAFMAATAPAPSGDPLSPPAPLSLSPDASISPSAAAPVVSDTSDEMNDALSRVAVLASGLSAPSPAEPVPAPLDEPAELFAASFSKSMDDAFAAQPEVAEEPKTEPGADVVYLARRVRRWRRMTVLASAIAALLAVFVVVSQTAPELIPGRHAPAPVVARSQGPVRLSAQLVAVLQQEPTGPAFLLTVDPAKRTLVVRRVSASVEPDRSYELWLISSRFPAPRSLGLVGSDEFTQRAIPGTYDVDTLKQASYAISLEPTGGSKSGAPTGPILFTGKMVESVPESAPPRT